jgi:RNA polymerase sigma-70 factor (ECF subfamily)
MEGPLIRVYGPVTRVGLRECVRVTPSISTGEAVPGLGDEAGVMAAYREHGPALYRLAYRTLGDRGQAEDVVQETFVRAWRAADRYDPVVGPVKSWLFAICRNLLVDAERARSARPPLAVASDLLDRVGSDDSLDAAVSRWQLDEAMQRLTKEHREVLEAVLVEGKPYQIVADDVGVAVGTVKSRVFYGLRTLRALLVEMGWDDG